MKRNGNKKVNWLKRTLLVLVVCGMVGLILTAALFFGKPAPTYASAILTFTFDGAADGVAPNGVAFDMRDIARDEVLSQGLKNASMADRFTPEQVRANLVVSGVYPEDMADQVMHYESLLNFTASREMTIGDYHPTTFTVALYDSFDAPLSESELSALLKGIMDAYRAYFAQAYAYGLDVNTTTFFTLDDYDYPQQLQIIEGSLSTLVKYANELYEKEPAFRLNGVGFNDISVRANALIDSAISRLNAELTINALTRNPTRLLSQYQFEIQTLNNQLDKQNQELQKLDKLIDSYEKNEIIYLSTTDALTKIDGNSSETYDALMGRRKAVADGITKINYQIAIYQLLINDLLGEGGKAETSPQGEAALDGESASDETATVRTEAELAAAKAEAEQKMNARREQLEQNIRSLVVDRDAILADFKAMVDAFNRQEINELTVTVKEYDYEAPRLLSGAFIKKAIKTAGPLVALGFIVCTALIVISRKKEENQVLQ